MGQNVIGDGFGDYKVVRLLGEGGFASVYLGEEVHDGTFAAVKLLEEQKVHDFINEVSRTNRLRHPNIVKVLDFGIRTPDNTAFIVMEYAPNGSFREKYPRGTRVPLDVVVPTVKQVASALQYAHDKRVIHRDVKPENLLLDGNDNVLLSDFGIALTDPTSSNHHPQIPIAGTPQYMAPEQMQGKQPRRASDQYALGVVIYEWLSGYPPFEGDYYKIRADHENNVRPNPLQNNPSLNISPLIDEVVLKALEKEPEKRHASVKEFAEKLEEAYKAPSPNGSRMASPSSSIVDSPTFRLPKPGPITPQEPEPQADFNADTFKDIPLPLNNPLNNPSASRPSRRRFVTGVAALVAIASLVGSWTIVLANKKTSGPTSIVPTRTVLPTPTQAYPSPTVTPTPVPLPAQGTILLNFKHDDSVSGLAWSPDNHRIASACFDGHVYVWDILKPAKENYVQIYRGHHQRIKGKVNVQDVAWSPDKSFDYIASCANSQVHVWNPLNGEILYDPYENQRGRVNAVMWWPGSKGNGDWLIASASNDGTIRVWDREQGKWHDVTLLPDSLIATYISDIAWSGYQDSKFLAACSTSKNQGFWVWDLSRRATGASFYRKVDADVLSIACSPNDTLVAVSVGFGVTSTMPTVEIYDYSMPKKLQSMAFFTPPPGIVQNPPTIQKLAWSPDGQYVAAGTSDGFVHLFEASTGNLSYTFYGHIQSSREDIEVNALAWSPDGTKIASGGNDNLVLVWASGLPPFNS